MRELPSGTVTFLFTDIEGSTRLLHELGDAYAEALAEHRRVLRAAFAAHGGVEVDTQGDAFFAAFSRASDALAAARDGQAMLAEGPIRVRMGVHTGEPLATDEGYVGIDVHRAARIGAVGHGGQVVVSQTTRELVANGLHELGKHRLKDFADPIALYQLGDGSFPPLKTLSNTNLPRSASSFVGRTREVEDVLAHLRNGSRLLTLTGPGGSGKTRLAIEAAAELVPDFKAGVFWVALSSIRDSALVTGTIARTLGGQGSLAEHIGERQLLLVLDNLEQVIEAAPELASVVETCANLRLLVTSRELLRVRGEVEYPVEPLAEPEALELFCTRARAAPDETAKELCRALDNLPLALELAAARTSVLSPAQILERLSERLDLFKGGRDADPRQQTLRATIEWSHDLLDADEQRVFARLAVFRRGCTLEAAQEVGEASLDTLQSLVDKALVRHTAERFWLLETIREFAAERLRGSGALKETCERHAQHFRAFAEESVADLSGPSPGDVIARVEEELENVRAAFRWSADEGALDTALALFVSLEAFWSARGCPSDFIALVDAAVGENGESVDEELRAKALWIAGFQASRAGEHDRPERLYRKSLELFRELGKAYEAVRCVCELAILAEERGRQAEATELAERALAIAQETGHLGALSAASQVLATIAYSRGDYARSADLYGDALRVRREANDGPGPILSCLYNIGLCARALEDWDRAEEALSEAFEMATLAGHTVFIGNAGAGLGYVALGRRDLPLARSWLGRGLEVLVEIGNPTWTASGLNLAAAIAVVEGDSSTAARLWGAAEVLLGEGVSDDELVRKRFEPAARSALGAGPFEAAVAEGRRIPVDEAVRLALGIASSRAATTPLPPD